MLFLQQAAHMHSLRVSPSDGQFWGGEGASGLGRVMVSDGQFWGAAEGGWGGRQRAREGDGQ